MAAGSMRERKLSILGRLQDKTCDFVQKPAKMWEEGPVIADRAQRDRGGPTGILPKGSHQRPQGSTAGVPQQGCLLHMCSVCSTHSS